MQVFSLSYLWRSSYEYFFLKLNWQVCFTFLQKTICSLPIACHTFSIIMLYIILIVLMNYRLPYIPLKLLKDAEIGDAAIGKAQSTWNLFACFLSVNFLYLNLHLTKAYLSFKWVFPIVEDECVHVLGEEADWVHIIIWTLSLKFELGNKIDFLYYVPSLSLKLSNHCYTWNWKNDKDLWEGTFCERTSSRC